MPRPKKPTAAKKFIEAEFIPSSTSSTMHRISLLAALIALVGALPLQAGAPVSVSSPDERVRIEFALRGTGADSSPSYRVLFRDEEVVGFSPLGVDLGDGTALGRACEIEGTESRHVHEPYTQFPGKRRNVTSDANEAVVHLREKAPPVASGTSYCDQPTTGRLSDMAFQSRTVGSSW
jgi:Glycosyl-hydrolase 97 N-terminal